MVSSSGAASHRLATHTLSSPVLHRLLRDETFQLVKPCCAAECGQQFPPSDGDCHTPLPCEVRMARYHAMSVQSSRSGGPGRCCFPLRTSMTPEVPAELAAYVAQGSGHAV